MFIRTERLFLRPGWIEDAPGLARALGHEAVVRNLATVPFPYTEDHALAWLALPKDPRLPDLLITLPGEGGRIVGGCGLHAKDGGIEVGYWIAPDCWNRGFATEAVGGLISAARAVRHRRVIGRHAADNPASGRVLRKLGFRPTGRARAFHSLGRNAQLEAPEYALELGEAIGPQDGPMRKAA